MTEKDLISQDLRRENAKLRAELERKQEEIELARGVNDEKLCAAPTVLGFVEVVKMDGGDSDG